MKYDNRFMRNGGSATLWVFIVGFVILAGVGYFIYLSQTNGPAPVTNPSRYNVSDNNSGSNGIPVSDSYKATSSTSTIRSGIAPGSGPDKPDESNSGSSSQNSDCNSYITASDVQSTLGLSSQTTVTAKIESANDGSCTILWKDPSVNPVVKQSPNSTGIITILKVSTDPKISISMFCKNKPSLGIGDVSCAGPMTSNPDGGIVFAKNSFTVSIQKVSLANKPGGLAAIARIIAGKM